MEVMGVNIHHHLNNLFNSLFRLTTKKTSKFRIAGPMLGLVVSIIMLVYAIIVTLKRRWLLVVYENKYSPVP